MPVQTQRLVSEFEKLVSFDAESYHERQIADYLEERLAGLGLTIYEDRAAQLLDEEGVHSADEESAGNLYGFLAGTAPGEALLFSSHMDTVSPGKGKKALFHENGLITSGGDTVLGADDAGGLAVILEMLTVLQEDRIPHPDIEVLFPIAEEKYSQGGRVLEYERIRARTAYVFDLDGTIGSAALAAPTILSFSVTIRGKSAHAGFAPQEGIHAIKAAGDAIARISCGWADEYTSLNIGLIRGGTQSNIVPDLAVFSGEIRSLEHERALKMAEELRRIAEEIAAKYGASARTEITEQVRAYRTPEDAEAVKRFRRACHVLSLGDGKLIETFGGSDLNQFAQHGIQGLVVASAMQKVHTTEEYTTVQDLEKAAQLAVALVQNKED